MRYMVGLAIIATALVLIFTSGDHDTIMGLSQEQFASAAFSFTLLVTIGARVAVSYQGRMGTSIKHVLIWVALFLGLIIVYTFKEDVGTYSGKVAGELQPGRAISGANGEVIINQNSNADFIVNAEVNGQKISFIFDTGADVITLTHETAKQLGLNISEDDYVYTVHTANGTTKTALVYLDQIAIGPIYFQRVQANVSQPGALRTNLLGRTFLDKLASYEVRGRKLILRKE